jgi:hypothetical protein
MEEIAPGEGSGEPPWTDHQLGNNDLLILTRLLPSSDNSDVNNFQNPSQNQEWGNAQPGHGHHVWDFNLSQPALIIFPFKPKTHVHKKG